MLKQLQLKNYHYANILYISMQNQQNIWKGQLLIYSNTTINQYFETYILHSNVELAKYDNEFIIEGRERFNSHINVFGP